MKEQIIAVISTLKNLFDDKHELRGFNDWDAFIGCIITLEGIASELSNLPSEETAEE